MTVPTPQTSDDIDLDDDSSSSKMVAIVSAVVLTLLSGLVAIYSQSWHGWVAGTAAALGATAFGAILGFIFGVPRASSTAKSNGDDGPTFLTNSNLIEISDWATKILVGLGLVELGRASHGVSGLVTSVRTGLGGMSGSGLVAAGILLTGVITGFIASFLITTVEGPRLLRQASLQGMKAIAKQVKANAAIAESAKTETLSTAADAKSAVADSAEAAKSAASDAQSAVEEAKSAAADAQFVHLAGRQLDPSLPPVEEPDLIAAAKASSPEARRDVALMTSQQRRFTRARPESQLQHDATIPVVQALSDADPMNAADHAQLGFALGEMEKPDYSAAIAQLDEAIKLRGPAVDPTDYFYEFARAKYQVAALDGADPGDKREQIASDLRNAAAGNPKIAQFINQDPALQAFLSPTEPEPKQQASD